MSHIIPAFVYRWLKDTSVTGFMRYGENPKIRVQDGLKREMLCRACENLFSPWEKWFADNVFRIYNENEAARIRYDGRLLKFCTSVSWRALKLIIDETGLKGWSDAQRSEAYVALERWKQVVLGDRAHPGAYEQHLLPLSGIEECSMADLPNNMNRYLLRGVEIDAAYGEDCAFMYTKMGRFALFGIICSTRQRWRGTRVAVRNGTIEPREYILPYELLNYLKSRARHMAALQATIPGHQIDKIEAKWVKNPEHVVGTEEFAAVLADERMFGVDAILRKK